MMTDILAGVLGMLSGAYVLYWTFRSYDRLKLLSLFTLPFCAGSSYSTGLRLVIEGATGVPF